MKLLFRQRLFSWLDSYDIYDEEGNVVYEVKGVLSWGHCLHIHDANGNKVGYIKEEVFSFLPRFRMYVNETYVGEIKKEFTFFTPQYTLDCNGWQVTGDIFGWDYDVRSGNRLIMSASKKIWNLTDTYVIDIEDPKDMLYSLMIVLAIDAAQCSKN